MIGFSLGLVPRGSQDIRNCSFSLVYVHSCLWSVSAERAASDPYITATLFHLRFFFFFFSSLTTNLLRSTQLVPRGLVLFLRW